jgi:predicted ArsR family transcriptional regulator
MTEESVRPRLGPRRARVLEVLRDSGTPLTSPEVAAEVGGHANSARFHLEALVEDGLVDRHQQSRATRGRPRVTYSPAAGAPLDATSAYRELAGMLAEAVVERASSPADASPAGAARSVGDRHGRDLAPSADGGVPDRRGAARAVVRALERYGFDSRERTSGPAGRIDITPCPFLSLARDHGEVVCSLHRGLMDGVLAALDAPVTVDRLVPFERPDRCVAHLRRVDRAVIRD